MKLRYSIGIATKMIFLVTLLIISAIGVVVYIATDLFREDSIARVQETNKDTAFQLADRAQAIFEDAAEKMTLLAQFATRSASVEEAQRAIENTLTSGDDVVSFVAYKYSDDGKPELQFAVVNESAQAEFGVAKEKWINGADQKVRLILERYPDSLVLYNSSPSFGVPLFTLSFFSRGIANAEKAADKKSKLAGRWWFRSEIRHDKILQLVNARKFVSVILVDKAGNLMAHSDPDKRPDVLKSIPYSQHPLVAKMLAGGQDNHQMEYLDESSEEYFGASKKSSLGEVIVVAEVSKKKALATIERVLYRSFLVMIVVVCAAFILNFGFSQSLTSNLKKLFQATEQIVTGNFDVNLKVKSSDEIGALAKAFLNMADGLKERDRIKGVFDKFHSKEIAKKLLSGEIKLGGERKNATVFFSDIRGFTAKSETMTPDQVVNMLNEYFRSMVKIIFNRHGVVDKYIGDAILALWGVPESSKDDSYNAVMACLEMRAFLKEFNEKRVKQNKAEIKIGMGLHSGEVLAGNIGSDERLEYTVIGDTVNQASRIEAATKMLKADLLISEATYALVKDRRIVVGPPVAITAKGKSKPLIVHQVIGYTRANGELVTSLTDEEIKFIESQTSSVSGDEEEKVKVAGEKSEPAQSSDATVVLKQVPLPDVEVPEWYVLSQPGDAMPIGPLTINDIRTRLNHGLLDFSMAVAYRAGDATTTPVSQLPGMDRRSNARSSPPPLQTVQPETIVRNQATDGQWFVAGPDGQTIGPMTEDELKIALGKGHITRTTYVWRQGMSEWVPLYLTEAFDRRSA